MVGKALSFQLKKKKNRLLIQVAFESLSPSGHWFDRFVVQRLHVKEDEGLGDQSKLLGLIGGISSRSVLLDSLGVLIFFDRSEEADVFVIEGWQVWPVWPIWPVWPVWRQQRQQRQ